MHRAEIDVSMPCHPIPDPRDPDAVLTRFMRVRGLAAVANRTAWVHVNRFTLAAMLGTFPWPAELQSAAEQVAGYLRRPENPGTQEIIDGAKEK